MDPRYDGLGQAKQDRMKAEAYDRFLGYIHLNGCTSKKAEKLMVEYQNDYNSNIRVFPSSIQDSHEKIRGSCSGE